MKKPFFITEVFAEAPYGGNQLATVMAAGDLPEAVFQPIARAFNFAETTFMMGGDASAGFDVRIFTPTTELPFAGHPTLGSAFLARREFAPEATQIDLNLGVGKITVTFGADDVIWMRQRAPEFGVVVAADEVAARLGTGVDSLHGELPCQLVSTGLEFVVAPVTSLMALRSLVPSPDLPWPVIAFCQEPYETGQHIAARMFASGLGVVEDAATGSANGCLAAYLARHRVLGDHDIDVRVGQGYEIDRPSQLYLRARDLEETFEVNVGGRVRLAAEGEWFV